MSNDTYKIVSLCKEVDKIANQLYLQISKIIEDVEFKHFFKEIAKEEGEHVAFWDALEKHLESNIEFVIFDKPIDVMKDLDNAIIHSKQFIDSIKQGVTLESIFLIAYEMEFYLLHPSFEVLFNYFNYLCDTDNISLDYDKHIAFFLEKFQSVLNNSPQSRLLSKSLIELWERNKQLTETNTYDFLTKALTKRVFMDRAEIILRMDERNQFKSLLMMVDIDRFKEYNDLNGHLFGDRVLSEFSIVLHKSFRNTDLIGRYGGDEFVIMMNSFEEMNLDSIIEKINKNLKSHELLKRLSFSFGYSIALYDGSDIKVFLNKMIEEADMNLYKNKKR